ncbi:hypothetical protein D1631_05890 [Chryseobacterium nematophagum]|uniref:Uncharacterized protein n=2 Tax=Chryseobacterium nematophagum TaxID=2305228 RepID=A0A3M7TEJ4_9FLAO|nr:hypothetical protein D1631_05890 [Chryseobacterium nematophagum]
MIVNMKDQRIFKWLEAGGFHRIINKGKWIERGSIIYAKEIEQNTYLLFVEIKGSTPNDIQAFIVEFESLDSIGKYEPLQIMFYMSIKNIQDLLYFEKYLEIPIPVDHC